jgi:hypothetical protein
MERLDTHAVVGSLLDAVDPAGIDLPADVEVTP